MPRAFRVRLNPIPAPKPDRANEVTGVSVRLEEFGDGITLAQPDAPQPAKLVFVITLLKKIRAPEDKLEKPLATLAAEIELSPTGFDPTLTLSADEQGNLTELNHDEPLNDAEQGASSPPRRKLAMSFDADQFPGTFGPVDLILPKDTEQGFHHAEIRVSLEIGGQEEAPQSANDVLDVPLLAETPEFFPAFELNLVDDIGEPVDGFDIDFDREDEQDTIATDAKGVARLLLPSVAAVAARLSDVAALKQKLKPRWDEVRVGRRLEPSDDLFVIFPREPLDSFALEPGVRANVSVQPRVESAFLLQSFFDTNKTFLLPDPAASRRSCRPCTIAIRRRSS